MRQSPTKRWFAGNGIPAKFLAGAVFLSGCTDLSLEADRMPATVEIVPGHQRIVEGKATRLQLIVKDQKGVEMPVPSWATPVWKVTEGSARVGPDGTLDAEQGGWAGVSAWVAGQTAEARYCVSPARSRVTAPVIYATQAAQGPKNTTPLIAGRSALLRIFLVADQASDFETEVQVTLLRGEEVVFEQLLVREGGIADQVDESDLNASLNIGIPGSALEPGVGLVVEIDPKCKAPLDPASVTRYPEAGATELRVAKPQLFRQVFVPTLEIRSPDYSVYEWLDGIGPDSEQMRYTRNLLPVSEIEVEVHDTLWTNADLGTEEGWMEWINEIQALNIQEGRRGYYYGAVGSTSTDIGGFAKFGVPWSVGISDSRIYTHEIGHNMDLEHADCGDAGGPDPNYPYGDGSIGIWGYDLETEALVDPGEHKDFMSYCNPAWVSDYHFARALAHRLDGDAGVDLDCGSRANRAKMLVVWGSVRDGELKLDPAFVLEGPAELPETDGPYRIEGLGADARTRFSLSFAPTPLEHGGSTFVYFVPWNPEWAASLDRMVLTGPEGRYPLTRDGHPALAVLTDPSAGTIRAIVRNWDGGPIPGEERANMTVSRGIPGRASR